MRWKSAAAVLLNFLSNAVNTTERGEIVLRVGQMNHSSNKLPEAVVVQSIEPACVPLHF